MTELELEILRADVEAAKQSINLAKDYEERAKDALKNCVANIKKHKAMRRYLDKGQFSSKLVDNRLADLRNTVNMIERRRKEQRAMNKTRYTKLRLYESFLPIGE